MSKHLTLILLLAFANHILAWPTASSSLQSNGTITAQSDGSEVWCEPSHWYDVFWFVFANYILHALSVRSLPGESTLSSTVFKFCSLLVPYTGVRRGLCLILRASNLSTNDLQAAARANALCMVVRSPEWRPKDGQVVEGCEIKAVEEPKKKHKWLRRAKSKSTTSNVTTSVLDEKGGALEIKTLDTDTPEVAQVQIPRAGDELELKTTDIYAPPTPRNNIDKLTKLLIETQRFHSRPPLENLVDHANVKIHGVYQLAPGYALSYVPEDVKIYSHVNHGRSLSISRLLGMDHTPQIKLSSTHDIPRILFSIIQTVSGGYSLYKARGSQIERYGYAAFGLTVLPYMMVSIINLIGSLLTSEYETVYLVHSAIMDEMKSRGGLCDGVVGTLEKPTHQLYVSIDRETETKPAGSAKQFTISSGKVSCHNIAEASPRHEVQVSEANHIMPVKEVWVGQRWRSWRNKKRASKPQSPSPVLCIPSHSGFTRLPPVWYQSCLNLLTMVLLCLALGVPYLIIGILTRFRWNQSTSMQRTFTLNWLICGQLQGYGASYIEAVKGKSTVLKSFIFILVTYGAYCTMGLVAVAQEMTEFGTCKAL